MLGMVTLIFVLLHMGGVAKLDFATFHTSLVQQIFRYPHQPPPACSAEPPKGPLPSLDSLQMAKKIELVGPDSRRESMPRPVPNRREASSRVGGGGVGWGLGFGGWPVGPVFQGRKGQHIEFG